MSPPHLQQFLWTNTQTDSHAHFYLHSSVEALFLLWRWCSGRSRIFQGHCPKGGHQSIFWPTFAENCMQMKKIGRGCVQNFTKWLCHCGVLRREIIVLENYCCVLSRGWLSVKFKGKTNRFKNPIKLAFFTILAYFSCISDRNWCILHKFP